MRSDQAGLAVIAPLFRPAVMAAALAVATLLAPALSARAAPGCEYAGLQELPLEPSPNGHYIGVAGTINQQPARLLLDTGASVTVLTPQAVDNFKLARRATDVSVEGAGGVSRLYRSTVQNMTIGPFNTGRLMLGVVKDMAPGLNYDVIVGSDLWMQADFEINMAEHWVRFFRAVGCDATAFLGYWDPAAKSVPLAYPYGDPRPHLKVRVNGTELDAIIDTGAPVTMVFSRAAQRIGLHPADQSQATRGEGGGIGENRYQHYEASVTLQVGSESTPRTRLVVADTDGATRDYELLLGLDWLRSHRVLFANSQRKLYFSASASAAAVPASASAPLPAPAPATQ
ncbi:hypothetical protein E4L96_11895 [Massilia arenosa]|uniref:Peptidase A2 domain-containing protein n=2 Tax=Zemynaea arenosa TaxID=2561931 RepID=A0A4Y9SEB9_9BURK|nr:hypothetical protein E4L96_11895 [Massilia arenosa]